MKFAYFYKKSDGTRCEGVEFAKCREDVFARLRERGIRPIKVEPRGWVHLHARMIRLATYTGLLLAIAVLIWKMDGNPDGVAPAAMTERQYLDENTELRYGKRIARPRPRKQIDNFGTIDVSKIFSRPSDRYLAQFAQPGVRKHPQRRKDIVDMLNDDLSEAFDDGIELHENDPQPVIDLKRIVAGLREEVGMLISAGKTISEVCDWLEGRQRMETEYRAHVLGGAGTQEEKNECLRTIGLAEAKAP